MLSEAKKSSKYSSGSSIYGIRVGLASAIVGETYILSRGPEINTVNLLVMGVLGILFFTAGYMIGESLDPRKKHSSLLDEFKIYVASLTTR